MLFMQLPPFFYLADLYSFLIDDLADPRTNDFFLVRHPLVFPLLAFYIYLVTKVGPRFMEKRKPFQLRKFLIAYNFVHICISVYILYEGFACGWLTEISFQCEPVDFSDNPRALRIARGCHVYYLAKLTELLDTVLFVLRKKQNQVSFLHLYHHTVMPLISWGCVKYYPGGHGIFVGMLNSFVHVIMYTYYMLSALGPQFQKYLWWKKYLTTLQQVQFCAFALHSMQLLYTDCGYPRWTTILVMPNAIFFYILFNDFYSKSYKAPPKRNPKTEAISLETNGYANVNGSSEHTVSNNNITSMSEKKVI